MAFTLLPPIPAPTGSLPDSWLRFLDDMLTGLIEMCSTLPEIKTSLPDVKPHCISELYESLCNLRPKKGLDIKVLEAQLGPIDWKYLDRWIVKAIDKRRYQLHSELGILASFGLEPSAIIKGDKIGELLAKSSLGEMSEFQLGPNWVSCLEQFDSISSFCSADSNGIPMSMFGPKILKHAQEVYNQWQTLKIEASTKLSLFKDQWAIMTSAARIQYLEEKHQYLPRYPHNDIHVWAQDSKLEERFFLCPLLNIEDLCEDEVLPKLLEVRQARHPALFRSIDGFSVFWGIWCGGLRQVRVKGIVLFPFETDSYGISLQDQVAGGVESVGNFNQARAIICFHQLEAQAQLYTFLLHILTEVSSLPRPEEAKVPPHYERSHDDYPTILARCTRESISRAPDIIDLEYIGSLVEASLEDIHHDFRQLRENAELWSTRVKTTSAMKHGKATNLLHNILSRIEIFHSLKHYLAAVPTDCSRNAQDGSTTSISLESRETFKQLVSIHVAVQGALNEVLYSLKDIKWPANQHFSAPLIRLFDIMKSNDPRLRVMGISRVLRVIDQDIKETGAEDSIPPAMLRALSDISVLAVCLEETTKHHKFTSNISLYSTMFRNLVATWRIQPRPYMSIAEKTIQLMSKRSGKLNVLIQDEKEDLHSRHTQYWKFVDQCMAQSSQDSEAKSIISMIQQNSPITLMKTVQSLADFAPHEGVVCQPTQTQIQRGKRQPSKTAPLSKAPISPVVQLLRPTPVVIKPDKNLTFWKAFLENRSELLWPDFCSAMTGIGYKIYSQGGSCYRFEGSLGAIVFHKPHGGGKVHHEYARTQWFKRLEDRFTVELE